MSSSSELSKLMKMMSLSLFPPFNPLETEVMCYDCFLFTPGNIKIRLAKVNTGNFPAFCFHDFHPMRKIEKCIVFVRAQPNLTLN